MSREHAEARGQEARRVLGAWLARRGESLAEFGKQAGVSSSTIHAWMNEGTRAPRPGSLLLVAAEIERRAGRDLVTVRELRRLAAEDEVP